MRIVLIPQRPNFSPILHKMFASQETDKELAAIAARCCLGVAKVSLNSLNFNHPLVEKEHRKECPKNVQRLIDIFRRTECFRLQKKNFINAIIDERALEEAQSQAGLTRSDILNASQNNIPFLNLQSIDCLSGLHRVAAAKAYLPENEQWWSVRLFSTSITSLFSYLRGV